MAKKKSKIEKKVFDLQRESVILQFDENEINKNLAAEQSVGPYPIDGFSDLLKEIRALDVECARKVAPLVVEGSTPEWLVERLANWLSPLKGQIVSDRNEHSRAAVIAELIKMHEAVEVLYSRVWSPSPAAGFFGDPPDGTISDMELKNTLFKLAKRIESGMNDSRLVGDTGDLRKGPSPVSLLDKPPAKISCAVIIAETWKFFRGKYPPPNSNKIAKIAELYWRGAGGDAHSEGFEPLASWKVPFREAIKGSKDSLREEAIKRLREDIRTLLQKHKS